jgi:hypothetical protein
LASQSTIAPRAAKRQWTLVITIALGLGDDVHIEIDLEDLQEEGIRLDQRLTQDLHDVNLRQALNLMCKELGLTWVIRNEAITITTKFCGPGGQRPLVPATYPVADLVLPGDRHLSVLELLDSSCAQPPAHIDEATLIRLITCTIAPDSWAEARGRRTIQYHPLGLALIVYQTVDVQEQIVELLAALRQRRADIAARPKVICNGIEIKVGDELDFLDSLQPEQNQHNVEIEQNSTSKPTSARCAEVCDPATEDKRIGRAVEERKVTFEYNNIPLYQAIRA